MAVIRKAPQSPLAYSNRGFSYLMVGETELALEDINYSLKLFPTNSYAYRNRARIYLVMEKTTAACRDLERASVLGFKKQYGEELDKLLKEHCSANGKL